MIPALTILILLSALVVLAVLCIIDLRMWLLPNKYVATFALLGIAFHFVTGFFYADLWQMTAGAVIGSGILFGIRLIANYIYKQDTLGLGDVKLMGAAGLWLGPYHILMALCFGALAGILHGVGLVLWVRAKHKTVLSFASLSLPAGPGFIIGILIAAVVKFWTLSSIL